MEKHHQKAIMLQAHVIDAIIGQPWHVTVNNFDKQLVQVASISMSLKGGSMVMLGLSKFFPAHSSYYLPTIGIQKKQEWEHEAKIEEYETCVRVIDGIKTIIQQKAESTWIKELEDEVMGFANVSIQDMLMHLWRQGGTVKMYD